MGRGYVIEHCVSTLNAIRKEEGYRIYLTEVLRGIARQSGISFDMSYREYIESMKPQKEETRTAEEVIDSIKEKVRNIRGDTLEST